MISIDVIFCQHLKQTKNIIINKWKSSYLRIKNNLSQKELSEVTGIHQANINKIELGIRNPSVKLLAKIANALDMNLHIEFVPRK